MMYYRAALDFEDTSYGHKLIKQLKLTFCMFSDMYVIVIESFQTTNLSESWTCAKNIILDFLYIIRAKEVCNRAVIN